jgi:thiamine biosynthesis protein ThiS
MAITVNGEQHPWRAGLTVAELIEEKKFSFPLKTVFVNGRRIPKVEQADCVLSDGDRVEIVHLMSGG